MAQVVLQPLAGQPVACGVPAMESHKEFLTVSSSELCGAVLSTWLHVCRPKLKAREAQSPSLSPSLSLMLASNLGPFWGESLVHLEGYATRNIGIGWPPIWPPSHSIPGRGCLHRTPPGPCLRTAWPRCPPQNAGLRFRGLKKKSRQRRNKRRNVRVMTCLGRGAG